MSRWIRVDATINQYISDHLGAEHPVLQALRERTAPMEGAGMQISHEQACFMSTLLRAIGARRTLEIGVFTGYSALMTALALPEDGRLIACDISEEWTRIAREYWQRAGVADKIDLLTGFWAIDEKPTGSKDPFALRRAALDRGSFACLTPTMAEPPGPRLSGLDELVAHLAAEGRRAVAVDLAGPPGGFAVAKVLATGLRPFPGGSAASRGAPGAIAPLM